MEKLEENAFSIGRKERNLSQKVNFILFPPIQNFMG